MFHDLEYAVYALASDGQWHAISYGDSEWECQTWLEDHIKYLPPADYIVGTVFEYTP